MLSVTDFSRLGCKRKIIVGGGGVFFHIIEIFRALQENEWQSTSTLDLHVGLYEDSREGSTLVRHGLVKLHSALSAAYVDEARLRPMAHRSYVQYPIADTTPRMLSEPSTITT